MDIVTHEICRYHEELQERSFFQLQNPRTTQKKNGKSFNEVRGKR